MPEKALPLRWRQAALRLEARLRELMGQAPERLDAQMIDSCYPRRHWVAGWRVRVSFSDKVVRRIDVVATVGFPLVPVRTALVDHPGFMTWPHVESDGVLCLLPDMAECDPTGVRHGLCLKRRTALILLVSSCLRIIWTRKRINAVQHQNIVFHGLLKQIPWSLVERLIARHHADHDPRALKTKAHLIAMLYAQLIGAGGLREIEANLKSHAGKLYHLAGDTVSRSALSTANASRPVEVFSGLLSALMKQLQRGYRRKIDDCVRLIDSTGVKLTSLSGNWATFSDGVCGAKAHIIYDPDADQPLYLMVTCSNVNDITAAKEMPIEAGATYVFDLGYYDYAWWARLDEQECRIVTRLKTNTPFDVVEDRPVPANSAILSDRTGYLPKRLAASRKNPMSKLVREIHVRIDTGKVLRIFTNDLTAEAQQIADLYKRRWAIELFFRWVKQTLKIGHFFGVSENAVRIQIAVAMIAFVLLRLAHDANKIVQSPLAFARLIRTNLMHRRAITELLHIPPPPIDAAQQAVFNFGAHATRAAHRRRELRANIGMERAA